jgi:site-specific DNA recombinase
MTRSKHAPDLSALPALLYARRSPDEEVNESVETQIKAGRRYIEATWPGRAVLEFTDDNLSGADETVDRPGYNNLMDAIRRKQGGVVVARVQSRITRQPTQWDQFRVACVRAGINDLHTWTKGLVGLDVGRSLAGSIMNLIDAEYVETVKLNVNDTLDERVREGRPHGAQPYGYRLVRDEAGRSRLTVIPTEAAVVNQMVDRLLTGHSVADVARWLNAEGVPTKKGGKCWDPTSIKGVVTNATSAGYVVKKKRIICDGEWDAIIDRDRWDRVRALLSQPRKVTDNNGTERIIAGTKRPARSYLLSGGTMTCHLCGVPMIAGLYYGRRGQTVPYYWCKKTVGGCGKMAIKAVDAEDHVQAKFMKWLESPAFKRYLRKVDVDRPKRKKLDSKIRAAQERRDMVGEMVGAGEMSRSAHNKAVAKIDEEIRGHQAMLLELAPVPFETSADVITLGWHDLNLGEKRKMLADYGCQVVVSSAARCGARFDSSRLAVSFGF